MSKLHLKMFKQEIKIYSNERYWFALLPFDKHGIVTLPHENNKTIYLPLYFTSHLVMRIFLMVLL